MSRTVGRPVGAWAGRRHVVEVEGRLVLMRGSGGAAARDMAACPSSSRCGIPVSTESLVALAMIAPLEIFD
ncbi:MAG: hypothetical protein ACYTFI_20930 [Planctomycetota bacterium]